MNTTEAAATVILFYHVTRTYGVILGRMHYQIWYNFQHARA